MSACAITYTLYLAEVQRPKRAMSFSFIPGVATYREAPPLLRECAATLELVTPHDTAADFKISDTFARDSTLPSLISNNDEAPCGKWPFSLRSTRMRFLNAATTQVGLVGLAFRDRVQVWSVFFS